MASHPPTDDRPEDRHGTAVPKMVRDPVCGMQVDLDRTPHKLLHDGQWFGFCCAKCLDRFQSSPQQYLTSGRESSSSPASHGHVAGHHGASGAGLLPVIESPHHPPARSPKAATAGAAHSPTSGQIYTCPMDPEVRQSQPGSCPICGMALEPLVTATTSSTARYVCPMHPEVSQATPGNCPICGMALELSAPAAMDEESSPELRDMQRRFWISVALSAPLLIIAMTEMLPGRPLEALRASFTGRLLQLVLATPVVLWCGWPFFQRGWASLVNRRLNMFTLIAIGTGVAYAESALAVLAPGLFPASFRDHHGAVMVYFESAAVIVTLVLLGQVLELRARSQTSGALRSLLRLAPAIAHRVGGEGVETDVPLAHVVPGDTLRVRPGEHVPVDGVVVSGSGFVDESMITGESRPVEKSAGEPLTGGTLNGQGSLLMRAERVGSETLLARIVSMVADAQRSRAPIQRLADVVSGYFVPAVLLTAGITFAVWATVGPEPRLAHALVNSVAVLIIACPCALGLATPMSIMVGTGRGATQGILIRNAEALERFEKVNTLVVDKTGTLTEGKPRLTTLRTFGGHDDASVLRWAASLEQASEHPLAASIVAAAKEQNLKLDPPESFQYLPGQGVMGQIDGRQIALGNDRLLETLAISPDAFGDEAASLRRAGQTVVYMAVDKQPAAILAVSDPIKSTTPSALKQLEGIGVEVVMLTGDNQATAQAVANQLGLHKVEAGVLPDRKAAFVQDLQHSGRIVAMAGDGVNDAPALAQADVGIAMGTGTDVAMQTAGVTLVKGDLRGISKAYGLSRATMRNIRQNLFFAFIYNAIGVPVAAGVLYPFFGLLLSPMLASAAMSFSSVSVIANALRLRKVEI